MSDERELPERVWIDHTYDDGEIGVWMHSPNNERDTPYLRADKPDYYVVEDEDGLVYETSHDAGYLLEWYAEDINRFGWSVHPVYIGPAIEPEEEESDE